ncbi:MAE_28990/MAE_18760 family HEPN-like nuclease [Sporolactobacillus sp. Y61]|uniref:MAE_28990/MAE_18760 family HEPN-like nuclease n=1 Tax=Sporolactobacillus sp. Y61 TaxID=3160863 RepID=A0AAU8IF82_9BACL
MSGFVDQEKLLDKRAQLEEELTWRADEIRLLRNQLSYIEFEKDQNRFRKALLVMLYSHYEGFCSIAFQIYIAAINEEHLKRSEVNHFLAASSMIEAFDAYEDDNIKPRHYKKIFKKTLPDKNNLQKFARQIDFVDSFSDLWTQNVYIPDDIVDTESNLWPIVLKKLLYRLGLPCNYFEDQECYIHELVNRRNGIAHGRDKEGITADIYNHIEKSTFSIMERVINLIIDALKKGIYLVPSS